MHGGSLAKNGDSIAGEWTRALGVTLHDVLRYGYGGVLACVVAATLVPNHVKTIVESLGVVIAPAAALVIGAGIYSTYRSAFGRLLDKLQVYVHKKMAPSRGYDVNARRGFTCREHLLEERFGVNAHLCLDAFRVLRDSPLFAAEPRARFHRQHSEVHAVYVTGTVALGGAAACCIHGACAGATHGCAVVIYLVLALIMFVAGLCADILLCRQECLYVLTLPEDDIRALLIKVELVRSSGGTATGRGSA
jgi:hypothetical protein